MNARALLCLAWVCLAASTAGAQTLEDIHAQHAPSREGMQPLPPELEARAQKLGKELRCPQCQGLSVADSGSSSARAQMDKIRELVQEGKSDQEVHDFFVSRYGEWALLEPTKSGFNLVLYFAPFVLLALGLGFLFLRRPKPPAVDAKAATSNAEATSATGATAASATNTTSASHAGAAAPSNTALASPPADKDSHAARVLRDMDAPPLAPPKENHEALALYARYENLLEQLREQHEEQHLLSKEEAHTEEARILEEAITCLRQLDKVLPGFGTPKAPSPAATLASPSAPSQQRLWVAALGGILMGGFAVFLGMQLMKQAEVSQQAPPSRNMPNPHAHMEEDAELRAAWEYFNANPADLDGAAYLTKLFFHRGQWNDATTLVLMGSRADPLHLQFRIYRYMLEGISNEEPAARRAQADKLAQLFATYDGAYEAAFWAAAFYSALEDKPKALAMFLAFKESAPLDELPPELDTWIAENQLLPPS